MEFLYEIGLFAVKGLVIVVAIVTVFVAIVSSVPKRRRHGEVPSGHLMVKHVNEFNKELKRGIDTKFSDPRLARKAHKAEAKERKAESKRLQAEEKEREKSKAKDQDKEETATEPEPNGLYVLNFKGDIEASKVEHLRKEITAVLMRTIKPREVLVCVESTGGYVHSYGFAASQLLRIREAGIRLTVAVDQVAASGGYMMAAVADKILAAPFAVIGSIGVAAELPNVHRFLKKHDIDYEVMTSGKYKRTLTVFGENTDEHREKMQSDMDDTHSLFQDFVAEYRKEADVPAASTGETWYGTRALELNLIDQIKTSDQYVLEACADEDVYEVHWVVEKKPLQELAASMSGSLNEIYGWVKSFRRASMKSDY